ncbi:MAG: hypothetical protein HWD58_19980 [Bacteroidota bacterium]|nr:MAG: hypothetical protein HWD58_19980 [Bacteroidota bacterium]
MRWSFLGPKNFNQTWYTGSGRTFKTEFTLSGTMNTKIDSTHGRYLAPGASSICDSNGKMQFCTNGYSIMGIDLQFLDGGTD